MKTLTTAFAVIALVPALASAGEVFGTVKTDKGPVGDGATIAAKCGANSFGPVTTDKRGAYRITINQVGKCTLTVTHQGKSANVDVVSFDNAAQADIALKLDAAGKLTATRG